MALAAAAATIAANTGKIAAVSNAVASLDAQGWTWFGLACEGGGRRNEMTICNALSHDIELVRYYIHWGKVKVPPEPVLQSKTEDHALFHNTGSWAATGSSGIITYKLQHDSYLHYMWDCPFNFDYSDNFVGLMLTSDPKLKHPDQALFKNMYMDGLSDLNLGSPSQNSYYDLVCCGPSDGYSHEAGGDGSWGCRRPCKVSNTYYEVLATMGDRHASTSKVVICHKPQPPQTDNTAKETSITAKDNVSNRVVSIRAMPQLPTKPELKTAKPCLPTYTPSIPMEPTSKPTPPKPTRRPVEPVKPQPHIDTKFNDVVGLEKQPVRSTGCFSCFRLKSQRSR